MSDEIKGVEDITPDPKNANRGTARGAYMLEESLRRYGAGRSILVDKNGVCIAGNKTLEQAVSLGFDVQVIKTDGKKLVVVQRTDLDMDDHAAKELAVADNRVGQVDLDFDPAVLAALAEEVDISAFFVEREIEMLVEDSKDKGTVFDDVQAEFVESNNSTAFELREFMEFKDGLPYDFPKIRDDMLAECPDSIGTWAGQDAHQKAEHFLYNHKSDSTVGLPYNRTILSFYVEDDAWEGDVWYDTKQFTTRILNSGLMAAVTPNFSVYPEMAQVTRMYNIFRNRYISRYWQEAGIKVIPDLTGVQPCDEEYCLVGLPVGAPCLSMLVQRTVKGSKGSKEDYEWFQRMAWRCRMVGEKLKPKVLLVYGPEEMMGRVQEWMAPYPDIKLMWCENRVHLRRRAAEAKRKTVGHKSY